MNEYGVGVSVRFEGSSQLGYTVYDCRDGRVVRLFPLREGELYTSWGETLGRAHRCRERLERGGPAAERARRGCK